MSKAISIRQKKVPTLYESDESKYVGPHRWQIKPWARMLRRGLRYRTYTRWVNEGCETVRVTGLEHLAEVGGPCLFVANHQSHLDTLVVHAALPEHVRSRLYFGAAQDRWFVKGKKKLVLQPWYQSLAFGNFPILRGGGKRALSHARWLLSQRQHVFLFPEGTRATGDALGEFKHGVSILALDAKVPVVPIYLSGLQRIRAKGQRDVTRGVAGVEILEPIRFDDGMAVDEATARLFGAMNRAHTNCRARDTALSKAA